MEITLNDVEVRVLGCLLEKSMTTPEHYPLSLNSLTNACNQKSNRYPVVSFDSKTVVRGLDGLKEKQLAVLSAEGRVAKYAETLTSRMNLVQGEAALLMILLLRGPQTAGELRGRTERAYHFKQLTEVEQTLTQLQDAGYVCKMKKQPGRKECRYAHLLAGEPQQDETKIKPERAVLEVRAENDRIAALENDVDSLKQEFKELHQQFLLFKSEFE